MRSNIARPPDVPPIQTVDGARGGDRDRVMNFSSPVGDSFDSDAPESGLLSARLSARRNSQDLASSSGLIDGRRSRSGSHDAAHDAHALGQWAALLGISDSMQPGGIPELTLQHQSEKDGPAVIAGEGSSSAATVVPVDQFGLPSLALPEDLTSLLSLPTANLSSSKIKLPALQQRSAPIVP